MHTSLYIRSNYLHSNTLLANRFQVLVARPTELQSPSRRRAVLAAVLEMANLG
jgi:hypothetical protein